MNLKICILILETDCKYTIETSLRRTIGSLQSKNFSRGCGFSISSETCTEIVIILKTHADYEYPTQNDLNQTGDSLEGKNGFQSHGIIHLTQICASWNLYALHPNHLCVGEWKSASFWPVQYLKVIKLFWKINLSYNNFKMSILYLLLLLLFQYKSFSIEMTLSRFFFSLLDTGRGAR